MPFFFFEKTRVAMTDTVEYTLSVWRWSFTIEVNAKEFREYYGI